MDVVFMPNADRDLLAYLETVKSLEEQLSAASANLGEIELCNPKAHRVDTLAGLREELEAVMRRVSEAEQIARARLAAVQTSTYV
ncbi:hypothetical protein [Salipiger sp. PrR002]|uniref:hypothetical protein n=1 Tax=Salipiger sp. PrR002 TaxID=2706489 RepID=UPI0013B882A0|nr:hypothetical protein [Salipiger sp. PrR002]NDW02749.1 hypothetical protein [Salipiger sp. PrR002]NDW59681.1 hypothetical protein [Salipiger sp. PrR004]